MGRTGFSTTESARLLLLGVLALSVVLAEQEGENLSGLSNNPDKAIFAVRENGTTCLMVEFAVKFLVPYDVLALNGIDLITEQAVFTLPRGAEIEGKCGSTESEIHISWKNNAYTLRIYFSKELREKGIEVWKISKVQFVYDTSETSQFISAYNPGKHTASTHRLSALVTPAGHSYVCTAQQTLTLISSDHQKGVTVSMYDIQIQPFDIASDFMFSEPQYHKSQFASGGFTLYDTLCRWTLTEDQEDESEEGSLSQDGRTDGCAIKCLEHTNIIKLQYR
ncbi:lysosome-associated membrane glycoprotein 5 isoform X1 [Epinephelus moara]|uniref:lysosome-associated membrane glycoprotein 5 isoform X1 n=1 Tax=Epinephelus moara TaxID=300413 RepID=UPI00214F45EA|nr:lysosome-associated membrane glycoprotein 5 isoform X1 [Epinephelus moara]